MDVDVADFKYSNHYIQDKCLIQQPILQNVFLSDLYIGFS